LFVKRALYFSPEGRRPITGTAADRRRTRALARASLARYPYCLKQIAGDPTTVGRLIKFSRARSDAAAAAATVNRCFCVECVNSPFSHPYAFEKETGARARLSTTTTVRREKRCSTRTFLTRTIIRYYYYYYYYNCYYNYDYY